MRKESGNYSGLWLKRVNYTEAFNRFNKGCYVWLLPCNVRFNNMWMQPYCISYDMEICENKSFSDIVNQYAYYNCNSELGRNVKYFVIDIEKSKEW